MGFYQSDAQVARASVSNKNILQRGRDMGHSVVETVIDAGLRVRKIAAFCLVLAVLAMTNAAAHADVPTLPTTGIDLPAYIGVAITAVAATVIAVLGGYFAFKLIKIGLRWVGRLGG